MNVRILVGIAVFAASAAAACSGEDPGLRRGDPSNPEIQQPAPPVTRPPPGTTTTPPPGNLETGSKQGEAFFASDVHPLLKAKCAACHVAGGPGNPTWIDANDAKKTYDMLYLQAYVSAGS